MTEAAYDAIVSLPLFPAMRAEDVGGVVDAIRGIVARWRK